MIGKNYAATVEDITELARSVIQADTTVIEGRATYLRALVATTIVDLGGTVRARGGGRRKKAKIEQDLTARQLSALESVHERFYKAVTEAASENLPKGREAATVLNRRTNFARTSMSAVRNWVRAGNDITSLIVSALTKSSLAVTRPKRAPSIPRLKRTVEIRSEAFIKALLALSEVDKAAALEELELTSGVLRQQLTELGGMESPVKDPDVAVEESRPLKIGGHTFLPSPTPPPQNGNGARAH